MLIERLKEGIRTVGVGPIHRTTGISRSILNNFAHHGASLNARNLEKLIGALDFEVRAKYNFAAVKDIPCDPNKKIDILKIAAILKEVYHAHSVVLFGSQAKGTWVKSSDIDFLVVRSDDASLIDAGAERIKSFEQGVASPYDVVTVAKSKLQATLTDKASVISTAMAEGIVINV